MSNPAIDALAIQGSVNAAVALSSAENAERKAQCAAVLQTHPETISQYQEFSKCVQVIFPENVKQENAEIAIYCGVMLFCILMGLVGSCLYVFFTRKRAFGCDWVLVTINGLLGGLLFAGVAALVIFCIRNL